MKVPRITRGCYSRILTRLSYSGASYGLNRLGSFIAILCLCALALTFGRPSKEIQAAQDIWQDVDRYTSSVQSLAGRGRIVRLNSTPLAEVLARALPESVGSVAQSSATLSTADA